MRRVLPLALLCLIAMPADAREKPLPPAYADAMARSVNAFAVDLYGAIRGEGNRFFSPYSVSAAIAMTRAGAGDETADQIDTVLHFPPELGRHQRALRTALTPRQVREYDERGKERKVPAYELNVANALWGQEGFAFQPAYLDALEQDYGAPLFRTDFRQPEQARKAINAWVEKQTRDKIRDIVPRGQPTPDTRLVLANAIYFKGGWTDRFPEGATKERTWHKLDGTKKTSPLMRRIGRSGYTEDDAVQVAELTYRGSDTSMVVILPKAKDGLPAVERSLTTERLTAWLGALRTQKLDLQLPRFEFTYARELSQDLVQLGMTRAFQNGQADFSGITGEAPLFIGPIFHKAFVGVDEEGTEAAAATVIMMPTGAVERPSPPKPFVADHPFLFLIRHRTTGTILFMGRLVEPSNG